MKSFLSLSLAADGMKKNKKLYIPYLLACTGIVMMSYILAFVATGDVFQSMIGGDTLQQMFTMGFVIMAFFGTLFLFYTNSTLMKQRKKEFGLYAVLGMGKGSIGKILFFESLITAGIAMVAGLFFGVLFSKLVELSILHVIRKPISDAFAFSLTGIISTLRVYAIVFLLLYLNDLRQIYFSSIISLVKSEKAGEKPPKGNRLLGSCGLLLLCAGYVIAHFVEDPYTAIGWFMIAVLLVIAGTFFTMISGSVMLCRLLQKKKNYYYKKAHFISVSSMAYRMKRNGAGLASICVLSTMVLVMLSTTFCLYSGVEKVIDQRYPGEINFEFQLADSGQFERANLDRLKEDAMGSVRHGGGKPKEVFRRPYIAFTAAMTEDNRLIFDQTSLSDRAGLYYMTDIATYNEITGKKEKLKDGEILIAPYYGKEFKGKEIAFGKGAVYAVKKQVEEEGNELIFNVMMTDGMLLIVPDLDVAAEQLGPSIESTGQKLSYRFSYSLNTGLDEEGQKKFSQNLAAEKEAIFSGGQYLQVEAESRAENEATIYGLYGGMLCLGILLSIIFSFGAVLIIYYKQITEGYEDRSRFVIMQKVGMTKKEIRKSINAQLLTVFFLPLGLAGLHLLFAFPMINLILTMFYLMDSKLFALVSLGCFAVFSLLYGIVYRITSNGYYRIVSGIEKSDERL